LPLWEIRSIKAKGLIPGWLTGQALTDYFIAERSAHEKLLKEIGRAHV